MQWTNKKEAYFSKASLLSCSPLSLSLSPSFLSLATSSCSSMTSDLISDNSSVTLETFTYTCYYDDHYCDHMRVFSPLHSQLSGYVSLVAPDNKTVGIVGLLFVLTAPQVSQPSHLIHLYIEDMTSTINRHIALVLLGGGWSIAHICSCSALAALLAELTSCNCSVRE